jgi:hypothetical protein
MLSRLLSAFAGRRGRVRKREEARLTESETEGKHELSQGIRGKIVDLIVIVTEPEELGIEIRFQDSTACYIELETQARLWIQDIELLRWKDGNSRVVKKLL